MRTSLRRVSQFVLVVGLVSASSLVFQNCAGYAPAEIEDVLDTASLCQGDECPAYAESIQIAIGNADPIRVTPADAALDIGGYCDDAGYPGNRITWQLVGPTSIGPITVNNACDDLGRFQFRVDIPAGFAFGTTHTLRVQLRSVDLTGREIDNPLGINKRELSVISAPPAAN